jgi:hypothetical protein
MNYVTIFDISKQRFEWWWPAIGLLILAIGIVCIKFVSKWPNQKNAKIIGWVMVVFGPIFTIVVYNSQSSMWADWRSAYERGAYSTVEGVVHDFKPMPYEGHQDECFWVKNQKFCYSDYIVRPGFRQSTSHGGPIREGLPVRIDYYNGQILRLDVAAASLTPEVQREAFAKSKELEWQRRMLSDPVQGRLILGFLIAVLLMTLYFNLSWRQGLRHWLKREPPYSPLLELGFRAFLLLSFISELIYLAHVITDTERSRKDFEVAGLIALVWLAIFTAFEFISGWQRRNKEPSAKPV